MSNRERSRLNRGAKIILATMLGVIFVASSGAAQASEQKSNAGRVEYTDVPLKMVIKSLAKQLKLNLVFDESFRDNPKYSLELEDITLESALKIILVQSHCSARLIDENTVIVFYDNPINQSLFSAYPKWPEKTLKNK